MSLPTTNFHKTQHAHNTPSTLLYTTHYIREASFTSCDHLYSQIHNTQPHNDIPPPAHGLLLSLLPHSTRPQIPKQRKDDIQQTIKQEPYRRAKPSIFRISLCGNGQLCAETRYGYSGFGETVCLAEPLRPLSYTMDLADKLWQLKRTRPLNRREASKFTSLQRASAHTTPSPHHPPTPHLHPTHPLASPLRSSSRRSREEQRFSRPVYDNR